MNYNFSSPESNGIRKLSILDALICRLSRIGQKIKNFSFFNFLAENLEKFRSPEHKGAPLEGSTNFLCRSSRAAPESSVEGNFYKFSAKKLKEAVIFYLLANPAETA